MAALLWRSRESGKVVASPEMILRAVARMVRLVQDLRDIVSIEAGHDLVVSLQSCEVNSILEEVHESSQCLAREKSIHLNSNFTRSPVFVVADRNRLLQVLFNLTDNAVKFTPRHGSIVVECEIQNAHVRFSVRDTGPGIPAKDLDNVFGLYWQAAPTAHLGSGLGLATAKHIVEQHGGQIWAGKGASFFFTIPAVVP
jgi:signal transduction histidine kinase